MVSSPSSSLSSSSSLVEWMTSPVPTEHRDMEIRRMSFKSVLGELMRWVIRCRTTLLDSTGIETPCAPWYLEFCLMPLEIPFPPRDELRALHQRRAESAVHLPTEAFTWHDAIKCLYHALRLVYSVLFTIMAQWRMWGWIGNNFWTATLIVDERIMLH